MKLLTDYRYARVLCVVAHMDDESLFFGGTLRKLVEQRCEVHVAVATRASDSNRPKGEHDLVEEVRRQNRRMVAFGRACGMIGVSRVHLLEQGNMKIESDIEAAARSGDWGVPAELAHVNREVLPSVVVTHGDEGRYKHLQHSLVGTAVTMLFSVPVWTSDAEGPLRVQINLPWKRKLLDCYRYGTTQDRFWSPYKDPPETSPLGPWLGDVEAFRQG